MNTIKVTHRLRGDVHVVGMMFYNGSGLKVAELNFEPEDLPRMGKIVSDFVIYNVIPD